MDLPILVDSNIYIGLMRRRLDPVAVLFEHFDSVNLITCGMVRLEVLRGVRIPSLRTRLSEFMDVMQYVTADQHLWEEATQIAWECDRRGHVIPGPDAVIAACALRKSASVLTNDADFDRIPGLHVLRLPDSLR
jgi:predicted nucleic acid-binding protein